MTQFVPSAWYWNINGAEIYSSASGTVVPSTDATYVSWVAQGNTATFMPTSSSLDARLADFGLPASGLAAPTPGQLNAYANAKVLGLLAAERLYGGPAVAGVTMPAGVAGITCAAAAAWSSLLTINAWGLANPTATQSWTDDLYEVFTLTGAQAVTFSNVALAYGQAVYGVLASTVTAIKAGTITTTAQVDGEAWPK